MTVFQSKYNKTIKYIKKLGRRRFRELEGKFVVEGIRAVEEFINVKEQLEYIVYTHTSSERAARIVNWAEKEGVKTIKTSEDIFSEISFTENPQGFLAVVRRFEPSIDEVLSRDFSLLVVLDGVQDPGNLGTIIRTSAGAGADGVILLPGTVDVYNPKTLRSTVGNLIKLPLVTVQEREKFIKKIKQKEVQIVAAEPDAGEPVFTVDFNKPSVIVTGSESRGVGEDLACLCSNKVHIPMMKNVDSLNVAVASGIILYEVIRQRIQYDKKYI